MLNPISKGRALQVKIDRTRHVRTMVDALNVVQTKPYNVWMRRDHDYPLAWLKADDRTSITNMKRTHECVLSILAVNLGHAFTIMQGENWSPEGEARDLIRYHGLQHTSMSVGDILHDQEADKYWQCDGSGWVEVS